MKSILFFCLFALVYNLNGYGQASTGINTKEPKQQLHVAGATGTTEIGASGIFTVKPTIRIDGLNKANNNQTNGAYALPLLVSSAPYSWSNDFSFLQPVSVTQNGDLLLDRSYVIPLVATKLGNDALTTTTLTSPLPNPEPGTPAEGTLTGGVGYSFTLHQTSMVHFMASVSVAIYEAGGGPTKTLLTDKISKLYHAHFRFLTVPSGSNIVTGTSANNQFGTDGNSYTNSSANGTPGDMYVNPEAYLVLPPGTYKVDLIGRVFGYSYACDAVFGSGMEDMVSIIATPLN